MVLVPCQAKNVLPSRITLGCMVEALASNNDPEGRDAGTAQGKLGDRNGLFHQERYAKLGMFSESCTKNRGISCFSFRGKNGRSNQNHLGGFHQQLMFQYGRIWSNVRTTIH